MANSRQLALACGALVLAAFAAYHNTFGLPFVFDDRAAVVENTSIRNLSDLRAVFSPPGDGSGVAGRPLVNLSFALNYAISGLSVWSYHLTNLLIHAAAGLALFGLLRRTLSFGAVTAQVRAQAFPLSLAVAALWVVHPLNTESVTFVVQRTESLVSLLYLLTLYCFARSPESRSWQCASVAFCALGMAAKEMMVTAPVLVLLYDRTFVAGTFRDAWLRRRGFYIVLALTWLPLALILLQNDLGRGNGAGFGRGVSPWEYLLTQCRALILYLKLAVWPHPLVVDYGTTIVRDWTQVWAQGIGVLTLLAATAAALVRRPMLGFAGAAFFVILSPSSSFVPLVGQTIAEHRMYLPLAAVLTLLVLGAHHFLRRHLWWLLGAAALAALVLTVRRNTVYRDELTLWADTAAHCPENQRAFGNLGNELRKVPGRESEAIAAFETALRIKPDYFEAHYNYGALLATLPGRTADAAAHFETVLRDSPNFADAHYNLAIQLAKLPGREADAVAHFETVIRLVPQNPEAHCNLGALLSRQPGQQAAAIAHFETAIKIRADYPEAHHNLALELAKLPGRTIDAIRHYEEALRLKPDFAEAHCNLGSLLAVLPGRLPDAVTHFQAAVRLDPKYLMARRNLALALAQTDRFTEAAAELEALLVIDPGDADSQRRLRALRMLLRR